MFGGKIGIPELLIVFAVAMLIFGPSKLASLGKSLGEGIRGFKSALEDTHSSVRKSWENSPSSPIARHRRRNS